MDEPSFKDWLRPVDGRNREAFCTLCKKTISVACMGVKAIRSHMASNIHQARMRGRNKQLPMSLFCQGTATANTVTTMPAILPAPTNQETGNATTSLSRQLLISTAWCCVRVCVSSSLCTCVYACVHACLQSNASNFQLYPRNAPTLGVNHLRHSKCNQ